LKKLNIAEEIIRQAAPNHFKINYQYKEYHLTPKQKQHSAPAKSRVELFRIHRSDNILGLILTFYISYALSARKTALILRQVFNINVSHQTVLNYAQAAAYYVHQFNLKNKGPIDDIAVGDETYIKVDSKFNYVWFMLCLEKLSITAYHLADNRGTLPAVAAISEAIKTARADQKLTLITDGNPAYTEALHYINKTTRSQNPIEHIKVIGLQNEDEVSEEFRPFKQAIERLNRTYKHHVRPAIGFKSFNGAMAVTALFVAHYNFLRGHMTLNYKTPIHIEQLEGIKTIQAKWVRLVEMMC
jgi:transposase-like protein